MMDRHKAKSYILRALKELALQNVRFKTFCLIMLTIENAIGSAGLVQASCGRI